MLKPSNPKDALTSLGGKLDLSLFPPSAKAYGALALTEGAIKYGRNNWRACGVRATVYKAALERHLDKWFEGEACDQQTGVPHLANALACLAILIDATESGLLTDDRNYPGGDYPALLERFSPKVLHLHHIFGDKTPTHYTRETPKND
jgi:hypothetical protein